MSFTKTISIIALGCLLALNTLAQWDNPADRYADEYKKFLNAPCPAKNDGIINFVYFAKDRELIHNHPFLKIARFKGAQIMYDWQHLEPQKGLYDFSMIRDDYNYLLANGKKLFIQLQDATFNPGYNGVPGYLMTDEYNGGAILQYDDDGQPQGWTAKRWNPKVRERFALLLQALGREFDGKIEGINLQETSLGISQKDDAAFTPELYTESVKANMLALKKAFPNSVTMQYANFMPGEWLPWEDKSYLRSIYKYGQEIGVGLGAPDLMVQRKGQLNHALAMMHENEYTVPLGIAVQDGNYTGKTGADKDYNEHSDKGQTGRENIVPLLYAFAKDFLHIKYIFWVCQEPYFTEDVIPCLSDE